MLRGLHYQDLTAPMGKLVRCSTGAILDVAVDLRANSPTFGKWFSVELNEDNLKQLWVPVGFGHGFATLSQEGEGPVHVHRPVRTGVGRIGPVG